MSVRSFHVFVKTDSVQTQKGAISVPVTVDTNPILTALLVLVSLISFILLKFVLNQFFTLSSL